MLLDGALGTQLAARGFELEAPLFSARALLDAPELLAEVHLDYLRAGAQILSTASFGLHAGALARAGLGERGPELARRSVELLEQVRRRIIVDDREAAKFRVAASISPLPAAGSPLPATGEDPRSPEIARAEYRALADELIAAGADLILLETFTAVDQARLALEALAEVELPVWLAIVAGLPPPGGLGRPDGSRLLAGDSFDELAALLDPSPAHRRPDALLLNCTQIDAVPAGLDALSAAVGARPLPLGLYPHLGKRRWDGLWVEQIVGPEAFAEQIEHWLRRAARPVLGSVHPRAPLAIVGACCGSSPAYIAALKRRLQPDEDARSRAFLRLAELLP